MNYLVLAIATFLTQFQVMVKTPDGVRTYEENPDQTVPIELPTARFQCVRRPLITDHNKQVVMVTCNENNKPAVGFVGVCMTDRPDENVSGGSINIAGPNEDPVPVTIVIRCRTVPNNTIL